MASRGLVEDVVSLDSAPLVLKPGGRTCLVTRVHSKFEFQIGHSNLPKGGLISEDVFILLPSSRKHTNLLSLTFQPNFS